MSVRACAKKISVLSSLWKGEWIKENQCAGSRRGKEKGEKVMERKRVKVGRKVRSE